MKRGRTPRARPLNYLTLFASVLDAWHTAEFNFICFCFGCVAYGRVLYTRRSALDLLVLGLLLRVIIKGI